MPGLNLTSLNRFKFTFADSSYKPFEAQIQNLPLPAITTSANIIPTRYKDLYNPSSNIDYSTVSIDCILDEDWESYTNVYTWLINNYNVASGSGGNFIYSDGIFVPLTNKNNPLPIQIKYIDMFPISIQPPTFTTTIANNEAVIFTVEFQYNNMTYIVN